MQDFRSVDTVAERNVLETDVPADRRQRRPGGADRWLRHGIENVAEPRDRQTSLVKVLPDLRQSQHRRTDAVGQDVEGDQLADGEAAVDDELGAEEENAGGHQLADELHALARRVGQADHAKAGGYVTGELLLPLALHLRLDRHGFEGFDPVTLSTRNA